MKIKPPDPAAIKAARIRASLTREQAASLIYSAGRAWDNWEKAVGHPEHRDMHPALWELFNIKVKAK